MPGFFMSRISKVRNMNLIKLIAFDGVMAMSVRGRPGLSDFLCAGR